MKPVVDHITDVTLMLDCFSAVPEEKIPRGKDRPRHFREEVQIAPDLFIGPLHETKEDVYDACQPRGMNWVEPTRSFPIDYAIYRRDAPREPLWTWDSDSRLQTCLMLSRLVRPTSIGIRFAARLFYDAEDTLFEIAPANIHGIGTQAWVANEFENWLRDEDIALLSELLEAFDDEEYSQRVSRAFWHFEHASRTAWIDVRWPLMTIALEALVHTDRHGSTRQFVQRILALTRRVETLAIDEEELRSIYDLRSQLTHGQGLGGLDEEKRRLYLKMEEVLRKILMSVVLVPDTSEIFTSAERIREELGSR